MTPIFFQNNTASRATANRRISRGITPIFIRGKIPPSRRPVVIQELPAADQVCANTASAGKEPRSGRLTRSSDPTLTKPLQRNWSAEECEYPAWEVDRRNGCIRD